MRNLSLLLLTSVVVVIGISSTAVSAPDVSPTIKQCASLLPKGKSYTFSLVGSIDTTGSEPRLSGELNVSDNSKVEKQQEGAAFAQCVGKLVR
jgi:hypothetical protein